MKLTSNPTPVSPAVLNSDPAWRDDIFVSMHNSSTNRGWPTVYYESERTATLRPVEVTARPDWTSLEQAIAGAGELSRTEGTTIAILTSDGPGAAYAAATLQVQSDSAHLRTIDDKSSSSQSPADHLRQSEGDRFDLQHGLYWSDMPQIDSVLNAMKDGRVVGLVNFRQGWGPIPSKVDIDFVSREVPQATSATLARNS